MKNFMNSSRAERKEIMHRIVDQSYCSLIVYYNEDNDILTYATGDTGTEYDILNLFATAASRAAIMVDNNIDNLIDQPQKGGRQ